MWWWWHHFRRLHGFWLKSCRLYAFFVRAAAGEFITRKSYLSTSKSRYLIVVGRFQILQVWENNLESPTRIGNNERSFPLNKFHDDHILGKLFHVFLSNKWPTGWPAKLVWFRQFQYQLIFDLFSYVWAGRSHLTQNVALCLVGNKKPKNDIRKGRGWWSQGLFRAFSKRWMIHMGHQYNYSICIYIYIHTYAEKISWNTSYFLDQAGMFWIYNLQACLVNHHGYRYCLTSWL